MKNAVALRRIMRNNKLTRSRVAELVERGESTVDSWLAPTSAGWHRSMPDSALSLLRLRILQESDRA